MTPAERIDANLDAVLRASGSALKNYTMPSSLEAMRKEMRRIESQAYVEGSDACHRAYYSGSGHEEKANPPA